MSGTRDLHAWVDESMVQAVAPDQAVYVLAASVAEPEECEPCRDAMRALLIGRSKRLHWRDEPLPRRLAIAETVARLAAHHVIVSGPHAVAEQAGPDHGRCRAFHRRHPVTAGRRLRRAD